MPKGVAVAEFEVDSVIGEGGFSIVYLATDRLLKRTVALKEYFPRSLAIRRSDLSVVPSSERYQEHFEEGLTSFVNEAQLLASFDHPALVKVYRFWEQNQTAYMAMKLYRGPTLKKWLKGRTTPPDEQWLLHFAIPIMEAVGQLHQQNCLHRDIAPDNVLVLDDAFPLLLDFGAARRVIGEATENLTVILKAGYSPFEQYSEEASLRQGPWTDVYALAALLYYMIGGKPPPSAVSRVIKDELRPAIEIGAGRYSVELLAAIDKALSLAPDQRPQSMVEFQRLVPQPASRGAGDERPATIGWGDERQRPEPASSAKPSRGHASVSSLPSLSPSERTAASPHAGARRRRRYSVLIAGVAASVLALIAYSLIEFRKPLPKPQGDAKSATADAGQRGGRVQDAEAPVGKESMATPPLSVPSALPPSAAGGPQETQSSGSPFLTGVKLLEAVYELRSPEILMASSARVEKQGLSSMSDVPSVSANVEGHVYVFGASTSGEEIYLVYPGAAGADTRLAANKAFRLPAKTWYELRKHASPGKLLFIVSKQRRTVSVSPSTPDRSLQQVSLVTPEMTSRWSAGPVSLAQLARCNESESICDEQFGAATVEIAPISSVDTLTKKPAMSIGPKEALRTSPQSQGKVGAVVPPAGTPGVDERAIERERLQEEIRKAQQEAAEANRRAERAALDAQKVQEERQQREAQSAERERQLKREVEEAAARQRTESGKEQEAATRRPPPTVVVPSF